MAETEHDHLAFHMHKSVKGKESADSQISI